MPTISREKIRKLPYDVRLKLSLKQEDFITEISLLVKDYPKRTHEEAHNSLIQKCDIQQLITCLKTYQFDPLITAEEIANRINPNMNIIDINVIKTDLPATLSFLMNHNSFKKCYEVIVDSLFNAFDKSDRTPFLNAAEQLLIKNSYEPYFVEYFVKTLSPLIHRDRVREIITIYLPGVLNSNLRNEINNLIQIQDIIT